MKNSKNRFTCLMLLGAVALMALALYSITKGASGISLSTIWESVSAYNADDMHHLIVRDLRMPRVLASMLVGAALAVAGAIMQGITGNPMADSGLMGLNSGAGFALALSFAFLPKITYFAKIILCFCGAAIGTLAVNTVALSRTRDPSPLRLVLAGAAVSALLSALSQGIALCFDVSQDIMFWTVGGVAASTWTQVAVMVPIILLAIIAAIFLAEKISLISLGEETAKGLGVNVKTVRIICSIIVVLLAGISVSIVGAVGFVGLIIPHTVRFFVGVDYRKVIPCSALLGALLLVMADLFSKTLNPPSEVPLGALISLIGVPFFLILARRERRQ